ncbi:S1/P1 nuclease [Sphingomonas flavalba]|uniref:S1/P1 nuclease n=1 Tax=Sphingomonas flavalba TaxID=2559804 RepID=UPI00109DB8F1|nr:S1/P1 nuclease [Sphingomonas flavalba]
MMIARRLGLLLAALAVLLPGPARAFWEYGHETVAGIALAEVRPATRLAIRRLLRAAPLLETPACPARTLAEASVWPDCVKTLGSRFSYAASWHYQDVDICKPFGLKPACRDGNCVSAQITRNLALVKDRTVPARERLMALAFLVHFVGDLHQPLHAGEHDDAGGNRVKAGYGIAGGRINLHMVWDGYLAERAISTPPAGAAGLRTAATPAERAAMTAGSIEDWSRQSWEIARDAVYAPVIADPCGPEPARVQLDDAKIRAAIPVLRAQVLRGGLRLARLLDEALG